MAGPLNISELLVGNLSCLLASLNKSNGVVASYHFGSDDGWTYSRNILYFSHTGQIGGRNRSALALLLRYLTPQVLQLYRRDGSSVFDLSVIDRSFDMLYRSLSSHTHPSYPQCRQCPLMVYQILQIHLIRLVYPAVR